MTNLVRVRHNSYVATRDNSRGNFVEWFPEQPQQSGQIPGFVKGGAYFSSRSLKLYGYFIFKEQK